MTPLINAYHQRVRFEQSQLAYLIAEQVGKMLGIIKSDQADQKPQGSAAPQTFKSGTMIRGNNGKTYQVVSPLSMKRIANARSA